MSMTLIINTLLYFFGLEFMVHDLQRLGRFGIQPLSLLELFCEGPTLLNVVASIVLFYTVRFHSSRAWAARKVRQTSIKHARGAAEYNLRRSLVLKSDKLAKVEFERDGFKRANGNLRVDISHKDVRTVQVQSTTNTEHAGRVRAERQVTDLQVHRDDLTGRLERRGVELDRSHAESRSLRCQVVSLTEEAEAREVAHQAERTGNVALAELHQAELVDTQTKLLERDAEVRHFKAIAEAAQRSALEAAARSTDSEERLRKANNLITGLTSRAVKAEAGERKVQLQISALQDDVQASREREDLLKGEVAHLKSSTRGLRAQVVTKEGTISQLETDHAEYRTCVEGMVTSYETVHECFQAKLATQGEAIQLLQRENDAMRTHIEGTQADEQTNKSASKPLSTLASLADPSDDDSEDSDTPSLTYSDSDPASDTDDSPNNFADSFVPTKHSTPASASARLCTLTTSTSIEFATSDARTTRIVTSTSVHSFASPPAPAHHSTPKRSRPSQRLVARTTSGFLEKVVFRSMELPFCSAWPPQKTSAVRPCDVPDLFSPTYRRFVTSRPRTARARFVAYMRANPEERHLYRPIL